MKQLIPHDESERLRALRRYEILDTPAEDRFDDIVLEAVEQFDVPIALFCLIDKDRQWFKSRIGLSIEEADRTGSFCGHVVATNSPLVVEDVAINAVFADSPFVTGYPGIKFYAGVPVRTINGDPLGTLCIIDRSPRSFPWPQFLKLQRLAGLIEAQLEVRQADRTRH